MECQIEPDVDTQGGSAYGEVVGDASLHVLAPVFSLDHPSLLRHHRRHRRLRQPYRRNLRGLCVREHRHTRFCQWECCVWAKDTDLTYWNLPSISLMSDELYS